MHRLLFKGGGLILKDAGVCEAHPDRPWLGPRECGCGAAGAPCPICNRSDEDHVPEMPDGFEPEQAFEGMTHANQGIGSKSCSPW